VGLRIIDDRGFPPGGFERIEIVRNVCADLPENRKVARDDRNAAAERLEQRQTVAFRTAREEQGARGAEMSRELLVRAAAQLDDVPA
jgi:hypothetical protein